VRPAASTRGWRKVARHVHDSNDIIDARSASPLAPDLVAALSHEGLQSLASSPSPCNHKYTMRSNIFVLDRIMSRFGTEKGVFKRLLFIGKWGGVNREAGVGHLSGADRDVTFLLKVAQQLNLCEYIP